MAGDVQVDAIPLGYGPSAPICFGTTDTINTQNMKDEEIAQAAFCLG